MYCIGFDKQWVLYLDYFGAPFQWLGDFGLSCKCLFYRSCMFILKLSLSLYPISYWLAWWFSLSGILIFTDDVVPCMINLIGFITMCLHNLISIQCINLKILSQISSWGTFYWAPLFLQVVISIFASHLELEVLFLQVAGLSTEIRNVSILFRTWNKKQWRWPLKK